MTTPHTNAPGSVQPLVPGVFAWVQPDGSWWINNSGFIVRDDHVVLVDTCASEQRTRALLAAIEQTAPGKPIRYAVNTHQHGDHTHGNCLLPASTVIVSHEATRDGILNDHVIDGCPPIWQPVPDWGTVTRRLPDLTTTTALILHDDSHRIELRHVGHAAHTAGDLIAHLPTQRVLFAGDLLFHHITPLVFMGSLDGALRSLDWIASFEPEHVVPGHGPVIDASALPAVLDQHRAYYRLVLETARAGLREGRTPLQAARACDLGAFTHLPDAERIALNLHRAYADLTGKRMDLEAAFADAVAYNNGPLPSKV
ncbi:MBL fold metallo-hydrolase [Streptomyces sp. NPDC101234]|uniref:MBL fold metallo-hydrolase n=1 Tax=Streptomyces sp. NPDC101234 TaxID=3366138 RepID=UPI0037F774EB